MKNKILIITAALLLSFAIVQGTDFQKNLPGDWQGTLDTGSSKLRVVFNITQAADGKLSATMDSPDQGAHGIPVDSVTADEGSLTIAVKVVRGEFKGSWTESDKAITGQWTQGPNSLPLSLHKGNAADAAAAEVLSSADLAASKETARKLSGVWTGTLVAGPQRLRLRVTLAKTDTGTATGTMDSLDQGANGIPLSAITLTEGKIRFEVRGVGGVYTGTIAEGAVVISGQWQQGGNSLPLDLQKQK